MIAKTHRRYEQQVVCKKCGEALNADGTNFYTQTVYKKYIYYARLCIQCTNHANRLRGRQLREKRSPLCLLRNYRQEDKKRGWQCDLDVTFVQALIQQGCSYCGVTIASMRIGLDRIDNSIGHIKTNVVPSCTRCNLIRRTMPYEAWVHIAPMIRSAYELGLFGNWMPGNKR